MPLDSREVNELILQDRELAQRSMRWFARRSFSILERGRRFMPGYHIDAICEHLEAVYAGEINDLLINVPPRHMKTLLCSVMFNAWVWTKEPQRRFIGSSYSSTLSERDARNTRKLILSEWYQTRWGDRFSLSLDQNSKARFENDKTGFRVATSPGGVGTGEGADYLTFDDLHKVKQAESKVQREAVVDWFKTEMSTRDTDIASRRIVVMQRIHEGDVSGHCITEGGWTHLMLPAEYEPARRCVTSIGWEDPRTEAGAILWPEAFPPERLARWKKMGSKAWAGQGQQRPSPEDGDVFKRGWWKRYDQLPQLGDLTLSADLTFKDTEKSDFAVFQVWGQKGADRYLVDQFRSRMDFNAQLRTFRSICEKYPSVSRKLIEDAANGAALVATVRTKIGGVIPITPRGSKQARAESVAPQVESGNVYLPQVAPWVDEFIEECSVFPNGVHDDQVDAMSQALSHMGEGPAWDWEPGSLTQTSRWLGR